MRILFSKRGTQVPLGPLSSLHFLSFKLNPGGKLMQFVRQAFKIIFKLFEYNYSLVFIFKSKMRKGVKNKKLLGGVRGEPWFPSL
jgi:hypothetical protein